MPIYNNGHSFNGHQTEIATNVAVNDIPGFEIMNGDNKTVQTVLEMMAGRIIECENRLGMNDELFIFEGSGKSQSDLLTFLYNTLAIKSNKPRFATMVLRNSDVALGISGMIQYSGDLTCILMSNGESEYSMLIQPSTSLSYGILVARFSVLNSEAMNFNLYSVTTLDSVIGSEEVVSE